MNTEILKPSFFCHHLTRIEVLELEVAKLRETVKAMQEFFFEEKPIETEFKLIPCRRCEKGKIEYAIGDRKVSLKCAFCEGKGFVEPVEASPEGELL